MAKQARKLPRVDLTPEERDIIAEGVQTEFFKIISEKILPQRRVQLSLTAIEADQNMEDIWYHRGMIAMCKWLPGWMHGQVAKIDTDKYDNDDEDISAEDDTSVA